MPATGSYDPARTTAGALPGELARLEAQAALSFAEELALLRELGLGAPLPGPRLAGAGPAASSADGAGTPGAGRFGAGAACAPLLEVGCGSGAVTRRLVPALPGCPVIALDADTGLLSHVPRRAAARPVCGDAMALPIASATVGAVLFRYVLQHFRDPLPPLREALRVLRPGGSVYVTEVDGGLWGLAEPAEPALASVYSRAAAAQHAAGGDRLIGRKMSGYLRAAGFEEVRVRPFAVTSDDHPLADFSPHLGPDRLVPLAEAGALSLTDLARAAGGWARFRADPRSWVMVVGLIAAAKAPPRSPARRRRPAR